MKNLLTRFVFVMAFLALLARAAIPAGYMPDLTGKAFQMVICTINGPQSIDVSGKFNPDTPKHQKSHDVCDFSIVKNLTLDVPEIPTLAVILTLALISFQMMRSQIARRALRLPASQSRAPPLSI